MSRGSCFSTGYRASRVGLEDRVTAVGVSVGVGVFVGTGVLDGTVVFVGVSVLVGVRVLVGTGVWQVSEKKTLSDRISSGCRM